MNNDIINFISNLPIATSIPEDEKIMLIANGAWVSSIKDNNKLLHIRYQPGNVETVETVRLIPLLIKESAKVFALMDGGTEKSHYDNLIDHFSVKTGLKI